MNGRAREILIQHCRWTLGVPLLFLLITLALQGNPSHAQCVISTTTFPPAQPSSIIINKFLTTSAFCTPGADNAFICRPSAAMSTLTLRAQAYPGVTNNPVCSWTCSCDGGPDTVVIDGGDGLPVELMDFTVEVEPQEAE